MAWRHRISPHFRRFALNFAIAAGLVFKDKERLDFDMTKIFGAIAIVGAVVAAIWHDNAVISGLAKAIFGVFVILVFLMKLASFWDAEKPETTHDHGGLMGKGGHGHH